MSEVSITDRQWERLMEVLWSIDSGIAELNKTLAPAQHEVQFTVPKMNMMRDRIVQELKDAKRTGGLLNG